MIALPPPLTRLTTHPLARSLVTSLTTAVHGARRALATDPTTRGWEWAGVAATPVLAVAGAFLSLWSATLSLLPVGALLITAASWALALGKSLSPVRVSARHALALLVATAMWAFAAWGTDAQAWWEVADVLLSAFFTAVIVIFLSVVIDVALSTVAPTAVSTEPPPAAAPRMDRSIDGATAR